jgi:hypothetical protein
VRGGIFNAKAQRREDARRDDGRASLSSARRGTAWASSKTLLRFERGAVKTPRPANAHHSRAPFLFISLCLCASVAILFFTLPSLAATNGTTNNTASRNIGIEGSVSITLPRGDYQPRPLDDRTELILRIDRVTALTSNTHRYEFFYMGLEPGAYQLADFLIRPDGSRPDELGDLRIQVRAMLPEDHDGKLNAYVPRLFPFIGGYRVALIVLSLIWVGGTVAYILLSRKKRAVESVALVTPEPSFAERLRPLVEEAAAGKLSVEGQAALERLLLGYWREKLNLSEARVAEALGKLKAHSEAGELLRALERWLHRPGGVTQEEVTALLDPYRKMPAPQTVEVAA